jgi:hypothetical protein
MRSAHYTIRRARVAPELAGLWTGSAWGPAPALDVAHFHPRSSDHRPRVAAKLLYDHAALYALFRVDDRYVRCVHTEYESDTYKDSCVELFLRPRAEAGYFALEVNGGGAFSLRYIEDPTRTANRFARWTAVDAALASTLRIGHSLPAVVSPETAEPVAWWVEVGWPLAVFEAYAGALGPLGGATWRGNCFKCGDETSHPHWASWAPIGEALDFHQPAYFGVFEFEA